MARNLKTLLDEADSTVDYVIKTTGEKYFTNAEVEEARKEMRRIAALPAKKPKSTPQTTETTDG